MRLLFIIFLGAVLRFTNLNWDAGGRLHPDEALIVNGALSIQFFSQLFPGFHDYNGLSVYLLRLFSLGIDTPTQLTHIGRFLSALLSMLTIPLVFSLGKKLWNTNVGMLAALLFTFTPLSIQLAHFYTTESIIIFLFTWLLWSVVVFWQTPTFRAIIFMGITSGLLLATKNTAYLFLPIPIATLLTGKKHVRLFSVLSFALIVILVFFLTSPFSFLDLSGYLARSRYLSDVVSGNLLMDWTMQFQQTNGLFWIKNLAFGMGPISLIGVIGLIGALPLSKFRESLHPKTIFAIWSFGFLFFLSFTYLKFIRYSAPLIPLFALFAAKLLWDIQKSALGKILLSAAILAQIIWAAMFFHIYLVPHPALRAATWITQHIPAGSTILREEWNSIIHFDTGVLAGKQYSLPRFNLYTLPDTISKEKILIRKLASAQYITVESPKVRNTIRSHPHLYPYMNTYYKHVDSGALGFIKIAEFSSYPQLGPFTYKDESAEETWYAFDHPTVTIYGKK